jgi:hypothetical protein
LSLGRNESRIEARHWEFICITKEKSRQIPDFDMVILFAWKEETAED